MKAERGHESVTHEWRGSSPRLGVQNHVLSDGSQRFLQIKFNFCAGSVRLSGMTVI
jgi:hypothetical protein